MNLTSCKCLVGCLALCLFRGVAAEELTFNRDIRPILAEHCFACHGQDASTREADLRLDLREPAVDGGAIVPGEAAISELVRRIQSQDTDEVMPPPHLHKPLSESQKSLLVRWIEEGATYQEHWSLMAPGPLSRCHP